MGPSRRAAAVALAAAGTLTGCSLLVRPSTLTMDVLHDDRACTAQAPVLLVLLPGAHMTPQEIVREGFVAAVRQRRLAADVAVAGAHLGYVQDGSVLRRLHADVIAPAQEQGYRRIWLAGISLGGFLAMGYSLRHPEAIEGIVTLAPYLGRQPLVRAIADAGGPAAWHGTTQPRDAADFDHELRSWLAAPPPGAPPVYLGYGSDDRFAQGHRLMATTLPAGRVDTAAGGHDWPPWRALWARWLDRGLLPLGCA